MSSLTCFKAYDIRGKLGEELNEDIAWRIGRAYGEFLKPKTIVLGGDVRLTSETLKLALAKGLQDAGVDVLDIGMSGTEEIYFATFHLGVDGGIEVTASHNPMDYNGMKLVREGARPISGDTGLRDVQRLAEANDFPPVDETKRGRYQQINLRDAYVDHLFGYINVKNLTPLKLVINSGNGAAGPVVDAIEARFKALGAPVELIKVHNTPDGNFPNGIPNPLLPECRTFHLGVDGGIEVTASHNPMDYNGMKLVREGARPISGDTGLRDVQRLAEAIDFPPVDETKRGRYQQINLRDDYVDHLFGYINVKNLTPLQLVINSGNGAAGPVVDAIEARFQALGAPVELIKVHNTPDGNFPNVIPNPLLPECRDDTRNAVIKHGADMGIAFDGDFDRCFLFDEKGQFIEGYYIVGLLAEAFLEKNPGAKIIHCFLFDEKGQFIEGYYIVGLLAEAFLEKNPGAKIIHDPRLSWNTVDVGTAAGGTPVMSKTGHSFIKERMRKEDAIYGGEMSAHHYFRDFAYCDSGMIPWLLVAELVCLKGKTLQGRRHLRWRNERPPLLP